MVYPISRSASIASKSHLSRILALQPRFRSREDRIIEARSSAVHALLSSRVIRVVLQQSNGQLDPPPYRKPITGRARSLNLNFVCIYVALLIRWMCCDVTRRVEPLAGYPHDLWGQPRTQCGVHTEGLLLLWVCVVGRSRRRIVKDFTLRR